jgi:hypothetical protein
MLFNVKSKSRNGAGVVQLVEKDNSEWRDLFPTII